MNSISKTLLEGSQTLGKAGVPEARREATTLLAYILNKDRTFLIAHDDESVPADLLARFQDLIERRAAGEPSQYVIGRQDFYGRTFIVNPNVLIPRPETELLVEAALEYLDDSTSAVSICDVGTGSGCIVITLLHELLDARAIGVDISEAALKVAEKNAQDHKVTSRVSFLVSDCFDSLQPPNSFDLIVSNPPYVSANAVPGLQREVRDYEPLVALSPGTDGLSIIRRLLRDSPAFLEDNGLLIMEIGFDQGEVTRTLIDSKVWDELAIVPDLAGIPRIVVLKKKPSARS
jgi:release factor glutamine methyltransferase